MKSFFEGKQILVTGGVGSIGSRIVKELLLHNPHRIRVFDNNETGLFNLDMELKNPDMRYLVGDIRDKHRLETAVEDIDIIFHAAALKHVPLCEQNPFEAVKSNVVGTQNVIDSALKANVEQFVMISTDKAVSPNSVMGASKLLAEKLTVSANIYRGKKRTTFFCVRFGNVLNSRGSVVPLFRQQVQKGYITITNPEMTRFCINTQEAVRLVLKTPPIAQGGEIFILKMKALRLGDLADTIINQVAPQTEYTSNEIRRESIGLRPGEKMHEELIHQYELNSAYEKNNLIVVISEFHRKEKHTNYYLNNGFKKVTDCGSSDDPTIRFSPNEISQMINST